MENEIYNRILQETNYQVKIWRRSKGIAPKEVIEKLDKAMLNWLIELTETLKIWLDRKETISDGELILARANLGAVVEGWLKFFYSVYYVDFCKNPLKNKRDKQIEPEKMSFEDLKQFSTGILWENRNSDYYKWVTSIQEKRNAIHSFNFREIGDFNLFILDLEKLEDFIYYISNRMPPLEDIMSDAIY